MTQPTIYVCRLAGTPMSFNEYDRLKRTPRGQMQLAGIKAKTIHDTRAVLREKGNRVPTGFARVELRTVIFFPILDADMRNRGDRRHDRDNYHVPYYKWLQDVLVEQKVIPDDRERCCIAHPVRFARGRQPMTLLTMDLYHTLEEDTPAEEGGAT
jgi:hypothetical protein